jgi:predicted O-linked N-acetylglucosamine transferase (SPINDLY family)
VEYLRLYHEVDIVLDTYPYNGTTTTCDALWMGVPVISRVGRHHVSRVGLSLLSQAGLAFFAVSTSQAYVDRATALAQNRQALRRIRLSMRERLLSGGFYNAKAFTHTVEQAYRRRWQAWCGCEKGGL